MASLLETIRAKRQQIASKSNRERPAKLTSERNKIRILGRWDGDLEGVFYQDFGQHFIKDALGKIQAVYVCTATTFGQDCPICEELARHSLENTDETIAEMIKEAKQSNRILVNAIYYTGPHANAQTEPVLLELPQTVLAAYLEIFQTYLEDHELNILDPDSGYDVTVTKTGTGQQTRYAVVASPKASPIPAGAMAKCRNLEEYAHQEHQEGLNRALVAMRALYKGEGSIPALPSTPARPALAADPDSTPAPSAAARLASVRPAAEEAEEVPWTEPTEVAEVAKPAAASVAKSTPAPSEPSSSELDELDALLNGAGIGV